MVGSQVSFWAVGQTSVAVSLCGRDVTAPRGPCHHDSECVCVGGGGGSCHCVYKGRGRSGKGGLIHATVCVGGRVSVCVCVCGGGGGGSCHCVYKGRGRSAEGGLVHVTVCKCVCV